MAPTPVAADDNSLLTVLKNGLGKFLQGFSELDLNEDKRLSRVVTLVNEDPKTIVGNNYRKKSQKILIQLLSISRQVFFLCAIGTTLDAIRYLESTTYFNVVKAWWEEVEQLEGLASAMRYYHNRIPTIPAPSPLVAGPDAQAQALEQDSVIMPPSTPPSTLSAQQLNDDLDQAVEQCHADDPPEAEPQEKDSFMYISLRDLLGFLERTYGDMPVQIHLPVAGTTLPSVHFGPAYWDVEMKFGLAMAQALVALGMGEMGAAQFGP